MMKLSRPTSKSFSLDLVPMINIVFLLLIFFMLTSTGMQQYKDIELPEAQSADAIKNQNIVAVILPDGTISLDDSSLEVNLLFSALKEKFQKAKGRVVEIQADKNAPFEVFGEVIEIAQNAGAVDFVLATQGDE